jgi:hypothetical protein
MLNKVDYNPDVLDCLANLSNDEVFTSPKLVNEILDLLPQELFQDKKITFLDPVTKTGVFLREITIRLMEGLRVEIPDQKDRINHILKNQVFGMAITELTSLLSRRSLYCSKKANGKYSVCESFETEQGNIIFSRIKHTWKNGKCKYCGASGIAYDRSNELETYAYQFIHTKNPEEIFNMKFDVIIGNPPYQLSDGGSKASAGPIYNKFVDQAKKLNPRYLSMIIPSRWFAGGKGLDAFRDEMLNDNRISSIVDYMNAKECFPGISLGGGVNYFLWESNYSGNCKVVNIANEKKDEDIRPLNEFKVFVRQNRSIKILRKIQSANITNISSLVGSRNPYGLGSSARGKKNEFKNSLPLHSSDGISYIEKDKLTKGQDLISKYRIMLSKVTSEHAGEPDKNDQFKILSKMIILPPNNVCTDSYLIIEGLNNKESIENLYYYLKTKFARFCLMQAVTSINLSKDKFMFVPMQDFTKKWNDTMLYNQYNLDKIEIKFIESLIKPM